MEKDDRPTTAFQLFVTAIIQENIPILQYLFTMHPGYDLCYETAARALIGHPNMEIMKLVHAHQPNIVELEFDPLQTFLTEACRGGQGYQSGQSTVPLILFLLDYGADPQLGCWAGCGALYAALTFSRPLEVIVKMVEKGGEAGRLVLSSAMRNRRFDALELLFEKAPFKSNYPMDEILENTRKSGDMELISVVEDEVAKLKKRQAKWWQFWK